MGIGIGNNKTSTTVVNNYFGGSGQMGMMQQNPVMQMMQMMEQMMQGVTGGPCQEMGGAMPGMGGMMGGMPAEGFSPMMGNNIGGFLGMQQNPVMQMMHMMMQMMQMMMQMMGGGANPFMGGMMPGMMGGTGFGGGMGPGGTGFGGGMGPGGTGFGGGMGPGGTGFGGGMGPGGTGFGGGMGPGGTGFGGGMTGPAPFGGANDAGPVTGTGGPAGPINGQTMGQAKGTGYYPANNAMEGGFNDMKGKKLNTLQDFLNGKAPYVSIALDKNLYKSGKLKYGDTFRIPEIEKKYGKQIIFKAVDTGGAFTNKGFGRVDICTASQKASTDSVVNGNLTLIKVG